MTVGTRGPAIRLVRLGAAALPGRALEEIEGGEGQMGESGRRRREIQEELQGRFLETRFDSANRVKAVAHEGRIVSECPTAWHRRDAGRRAQEPEDSRRGHRGGVGVVFCPRARSFGECLRLGFGSLVRWAGVPL